MQPGTVRRVVARSGFYVAVVVLVLMVWRIQYFMDAKTFGPNTIFFSSSTDAPSQWQQMGVQAVSETNSLLTTLATGLLGALGLLLNRGRNRPKRIHLYSAFLCAVGGGLSLYFGYVSHLHLLWMIKNNTFDPYSPVYILPSHFQFYTLLAGTFFFADFAVHDLNEEN